MTAMPIHKYRPFPPIDLPDRQWPSRVIDKAPIWCSRRSARRQPGAGRADGARDASAACSTCWCGSASRRSRSASRPPRKPISAFVREIIEQDLIPDDVTIQVLTQSRPELIEQDLRGDPRRQARDRASLQFDLGHCSAASCSVSTAPGIIDIAVTGAPADPRAGRGDAGDRDHLSIFARELQRHRTRFRGRDLRGGDGCLAADAGEKDDPQPAGHRRDGDAEHLCRPDRMVRAAISATATA